MPKGIILSFNDLIFPNALDVFKASKTLGVSSFVFLVRALNLNLISLQNCQNLKTEAEIEYQAFLKREAEKKGCFKT